MPAVIPNALADAGAGAAALTAVIALLVLVSGIITRAWRRATAVFHDATVDTIREEVPRAVEAALPVLVEDLVRGELERAIEPHAAMLRSELRTITAEMQPNGGSSLRDQLDRVTGDVGDLKDGQAVLERQVRAVFARIPQPAPDLEDLDAET